MMNRICIALACLAFAGHGRRMQTATGQTQRRQSVERDVMKSLATLLFANSPDAAFNSPLASGAGLDMKHPAHTWPMHRVSPCGGLLCADAVATDDIATDAFAPEDVTTDAGATAEDKKLKLRLRKKENKDFYKEMKGLSIEELWHDMRPEFDEASPAERQQQVGLIRAIGMKIASFRDQSKIDQEIKMEAQGWLEDLLEDESEKVRGYAIDALGRVGGDDETEQMLLNFIQISHSERERQRALDALTRIAKTSEIVEEAREAAAGMKPEAKLKVEARLAGMNSPSSLVMEKALDLKRLPELYLHFHVREAHEVLMANELKSDLNSVGSHAFRPVSADSGCVVAEAIKNFRLADLYLLRRFDTVSFVLWQAESEGEVSTDVVARAIASEKCQEIISTFSRGSLRYKLDVSSFKETVQGGVKQAARDIATAAYDLNPSILHDQVKSVWSIQVNNRLTPDGAKRVATVELKPRVMPDPRTVPEFRQHFKHKA
mmetsp:Transcript_23911/g.41850  ORF Transcript_23911/g.41850 Transcript_23911/m.41850 type:complete len:490 (-) Transcript_23911:112-1581(-)